MSTVMGQTYLTMDESRILLISSFSSSSWDAEAHGHQTAYGACCSKLITHFRTEQTHRCLTSLI